MQNIYNIAEICYQLGIRDFILSPGSRCAPLTIAFARHTGIRTRTISDERSAAFIAIGCSQHTKRTTGLVCTSGSAAYNYAPAVAEAFYQQIPLLILTADRPPEWVDQLDGQTIRQENIYGRHVKESYNLPADHTNADSRWHIERTISEAILLSQTEPKGPVHVNIPLREPFYPKAGEEITFDKSVKVIRTVKGTLSVSEALRETVKDMASFRKVLVVAGQEDLSHAVYLAAEALAKKQIPCVGDIISNLNGEFSIKHHDIILSAADKDKKQQLAPDLLITFGKSLISKTLKQFLRSNEGMEHWHLQEHSRVADTFQRMTRLIEATPALFAEAVADITPGKEQAAYKDLWKSEEEKAQHRLEEFFQQDKPFTEFHALRKVLERLPDHSVLHIANSMPVRYLNYLALRNKNIEVYCNRGTSGIDGVISTAYGAALTTSKIVTVVTGDLAFFYDRNAFWNNYLPPNLRIVMLNNHGGGIFRIIEGPSKLPELDEYFETRQALNARSLAGEYGISYELCRDEKEVLVQLKDFFANEKGASILEIETDSKTNTEVFQNFKKFIS